MSMNRARNVSTIVAGVLIATALAVTARSRDDNQRFAGYQDCADVNQTGSQFSESNCIEGHDCVFCMVTHETGMRVSGSTGGLRLKDANTVQCQGDRIIGYCTATATDPEAGLGLCDLSNYWVDGVCSNSIKKYEYQPVTGPGTDP